MDYVRARRARQLGLVVGALAWYAGLRQAYVLGHEFGAEYVYVLATVLVGMYMNFEARREGTLSAYSLFNANGERIAGSLTADEIDNQMRSGNVGATNQAAPLAIGRVGLPLGPGRRLGSASESRDGESSGQEGVRDQETQRRLRQERAAAAALRRRSQLEAQVQEDPQSQ